MPAKPFVIDVERTIGVAYTCGVEPGCSHVRRDDAYRHTWAADALSLIAGLADTVEFMDDDDGECDLVVRARAFLKAVEESSDAD